MNALPPNRLLRVAEDASIGTDQVAVLGRDIRTSSERIARYCVTTHEPVYEDLPTLVESMAFLDRLIVRSEARVGRAIYRSKCPCMSTFNFSVRRPSRLCPRPQGS